MKYLYPIVFLTVFSFVNAYADHSFYRLVMSEDDKVCQHMLSVYNTDLITDGRLLLNQHQEYNSIKWDKDIQIKEGQYLYRQQMQVAKISVFDINNDARKEVVLFHRPYPTSSMAAMDLFDYFPYELYEKVKTNIQIKELLRFHIGERLLGKNLEPYILKKLPAQRVAYRNGVARPDYSSNYVYMSSFMYIRPFVYNGTSFVSLIGADYNVPFDNTNLISIRKYKSDNALEDVCYYVKTQIVDRISLPKPHKK